MGLAAVSCAADDDGDYPLFRIGFSTRMFVDVDDNDAEAAVTAWARSVARERQVPTDTHPRILTGVSKITAAVVSGDVDAVAMPLDEYVDSGREKVYNEILLSTEKNGSHGDRYVLLTHAQSGLASLESLTGKSLLILDSARMSLSQPWLENRLFDRSLPNSRSHFSKIVSEKKLNRVALPVFFRRYDACLLHERGFDILTELNPQLRKQLKVIDSSRPLIASLLCFRADYDAPNKAQVFSALTELHQSITGEQILDLFKSDRLIVHTSEILKDSISELEKHRVRAAAAKSAKAPPAK